MDELQAQLERDKEAHQAEIKKQKKELESQKESSEKELEIKQTQSDKSNIENDIADKNNQRLIQEEETKSKIARDKLEEDRMRREENDMRSESRRKRVWGWLKMILIGLLIIFLIILILLGLYRTYRWAVEEPIIQTVEKRIEVPVEVLVEKIVEKTIEVEVEVEKIVEKEVEVIPDECTQIRRNGKVYVSCDGVTVNGSSTISESGISDIPDLVTE